MRVLRVSLLFAIILTAGCASDYMTDRWRDTLDMATCTVNSSLGGTGRVGPFRAGLYAGVDLAGLRGGECRKMDLNEYGDAADWDLALATRESFVPKNFEIARARGKLYKAAGAFTLTVLTEMDGDDHPWPRYLPYYTDAQVALGLLVGVRLGLNTGEVVDWLLGWCLVDIFADDIGAGDPYTRKVMDYQQAIQESARQTPQKPGQPTAPQQPTPEQPAPQQITPQMPPMPQTPVPQPQTPVPQPQTPQPPAPQPPTPQPQGYQPELYQTPPAVPQPQALPQQPAPQQAPAPQTVPQPQAAPAPMPAFPNPALQGFKPIGK